jgi:hypothetical protein
LIRNLEKTANEARSEYGCGAHQCVKDKPALILDRRCELSSLINVTPPVQ